MNELFWTLGLGQPLPSESERRTPLLFFQLHPWATVTMRTRSCCPWARRGGGGRPGAQLAGSADPEAARPRTVLVMGGTVDRLERGYPVARG
ncbi:MAG TPA: hypothetical protein VKY90_11170 [Candidatus Dormibacteraeota bacterium]|nr:hypothetical protein [Candidatus Dormibacteraeota bacterium]